MSLTISHQRQSSQSGMIAILVTLLMMIIISLLVLGFAQVSRHEQGNTTNTQLSTQAYYAAESGINDAGAAIQHLLSTSGTVTNKDVCADTADYKFNTPRPNRFCHREYRTRVYSSMRSQHRSPIKGWTRRARFFRSYPVVGRTLAP
jgi:Tfp pilus assembly protein PilX